MAQVGEVTPVNTSEASKVNGSLNTITQKTGNLRIRLAEINTFLFGEYPSPDKACDTVERSGWVGKVEDSLDEIIDELNECFNELKQLEERLIGDN